VSTVLCSTLSAPCDGGQQLNFVVWSQTAAQIGKHVEELPQGGIDGFASGISISLL
jgi:hypothetical protein